MYVWFLGIPLEGYGSWTLTDDSEESGVEPDECYVRDGLAEERPDLAIEVVHTSGGLSKLEAYRRLGVGEVWYWVDDQLRPFVLRGDRFEPTETSALLPELDLELIAACMQQSSQVASLEMLEDELRRRGEVAR